MDHCLCCTVRVTRLGQLPSSAGHGSPRTRSLLGGTAVEVTKKPVGTLGAESRSPCPCASY